MDRHDDNNAPRQIHGIPNGAVYIGRANHGLKRSKWANPFVEDKRGTLAEVIAMYERWLFASPGERAEMIAAFKLPQLRGKDLVCWCAPEPCHGDFGLPMLSRVGRCH